jgi:quercetin dioxygenase-like cupin family protein
MIVKAENANVQQVEPGIARQVLGHDDHLMMVRVTLSKGAVAALHAHPHRQVTYVERGTFQATVDGATAVVGPGDCYFVQPDAQHGVVALEDGVLIDVFSPAREEFVTP